MLFDIKAKTPEFPRGKEYPYFNESTTAPSILDTRPRSYDDLDYWLERTPEMISIIDAIVTDIVSDGFQFIGAQSNVERASNFAKLVRYEEQLKNALWDRLVYGDDYIWLGIPGEKTTAEIFRRLTGKEPDFDLTQDEDFLKMLKYVPSNTMSIIHDGRVITGFKQDVKGRSEKPIKFTTEQIVHGKYLTLKGRLLGWSPMMSNLPEMQTLAYVKQYALDYFKKGGSPDKIYILPLEMAGSPNHIELRQQLEKYKNPVTKRGNMVFTGDLKVEDLSDGFSKDMEFRQLAIYLTAVLAHSYGMPMSRIGSIIGAEVKIGSGSDELANEGYWSKIGTHQAYTERLHNEQIWQKYFKVSLKFNKSWKTNEIKENQRDSFMLANINTLNSEIAKYDIQLSPKFIKRKLGISSDDCIPLSEVNEDFLNVNKGVTPEMDKKKIAGADATEKKREEKRKQVLDSQKA